MLHGEGFAVVVPLFAKATYISVLRNIPPMAEWTPAARGLCVRFALSVQGAFLCFVVARPRSESEAREVQLSSRTILPKAKKEDSSFDESLVAEMGFEKRRETVICYFAVGHAKRRSMPPLWWRA